MDQAKRLSGFILFLLAAAVTQPAAALASSATRMLTLPTQVYATVTNEREGQAGTVYFLVLQKQSADGATPIELQLSYKARSAEVKRETLSGEALKAVRLELSPMRLTGKEPDRPTFWPHAFRIDSYFPAALGVDAIEARLRFQDAGGEQVVTLDFPVGRYEQKTQLIFPFHGPGIISVGGAAQSGHRNRSGLYAVDALGLTANYGPMLTGAGGVRDYAGWDRPVLAPAAGRVLFARNDRPDQPEDGESNSKYYAPEYPNGGDPGNSVVIDHGNGEFSMIAHMRMGSVTVKEGDLVEQGREIGRLGNSGDTTGPHVHYQLQSGPRWEFSDALPFTFTNVRNITRGSYFDAR